MKRISASMTFVFLLMAFTCFFSHAKEEGLERGGGDDVATEFQQIGIVIASQIQDIPYYQRLFDTRGFSKPTKDINLLYPINRVLKLPNGRVVTAINERNPDRILINRTRFKAEPLARKRRLVFHEYLGVLGGAIEQGGQRRARIDDNNEISGSLFSSPLVPSLEDLGLIKAVQRSPLPSNLVGVEKDSSVSGRFFLSAMSAFLQADQALKDNQFSRSRNLLNEFSEQWLLSLFYIVRNLATLSPEEAELTADQAMKDFTKYFDFANQVAPLSEQLRKLPAEDKNDNVLSARVALRMAQGSWLLLVLHAIVDRLPTVEKFKRRYNMNSISQIPQYVDVVSVFNRPDLGRSFAAFQNKMNGRAGPAEVEIYCRLLRREMDQLLKKGDGNWENIRLLADELSRHDISILARSEGVSADEMLAHIKASIYKTIEGAHAPGLDNDPDYREVQNLVSRLRSYLD